QRRRGHSAFDRLARAFRHPWGRRQDALCSDRGWRRGFRHRRLSASGGECHRGFWRPDTEAKALLQIEVDAVGVVMAVAEGQVLARLEEEIATAEANHHGAGDTRSPDDRTAQYLTEVVEHDEAAVLGRFDHTGVLLGPERKPVGTAHAGFEKRLDRLGNVAGIAGVGGAQLDGRVGPRGRYSDDAGLGPAVED